MPSVQQPAVLNAVYQAAEAILKRRQAPTELLPADQPLFHFFHPRFFHINTDDVFPRHLANQQLAAYDLGRDVNRFTGMSRNPGIADAGGLYCSLQQQALVNELLHYSRHETPRADIAFHRKCMVRIRLMGARLVLDLSPHNAHAQPFVEEIGKAAGIAKPWEQLFDGDDCSLARGIGLAAAHSGYLHGLKAQTVRKSERSIEENGDNVVFFSDDAKPISGMWIDRAYFFPLFGPPVMVPVAY